MLYGATWFAVRSDVVIATKNIWKEVNLFYKPRIADKTKYENVYCVIESEDVKYQGQWHWQVIGGASNLRKLIKKLKENNKIIKQ